VCKVRTDCAISSVDSPGCLTDAISWSAAATTTEARGATSWLDNSKHAGSFSLNSLSSVGNSRLADAYLSSIRVTASERMLTRCRRGDILVETGIHTAQSGGLWWGGDVSGAQERSIYTSMGCIRDRTGARRQPRYRRRALSNVRDRVRTSQHRAQVLRNYGWTGIERFECTRISVNDVTSPD